MFNLFKEQYQREATEAQEKANDVQMQLLWRVHAYKESQAWLLPRGCPSL